MPFMSLVRLTHSKERKLPVDKETGVHLQVIHLYQDESITALPSGVMRKHRAGRITVLPSRSHLRHSASVASSL